MTGFDRRLKDLLEKVRAAAEREGIQWRKADEDVYAFRAGPYVVTFSKEADPQLAIYDEDGEEVEAIDRADLEGRNAADGRTLEEIKARVWRLARRGAGASAGALDKVLDWLDEKVEETAPAEPEKPGPAAEGDLGRAHGDVKEPEFSPQAPQAGVGQNAGETDEPEERETPTNGNGNPARPPWAQ